MIGLLWFMRDDIGEGGLSKDMFVSDKGMSRKGRDMKLCGRLQALRCPGTISVNLR